MFERFQTPNMKKAVVGIAPITAPNNKNNPTTGGTYGRVILIM